MSFRYPNFIIYPGTGMWVIYENGRMRLSMGLSHQEIKLLLTSGADVYWINRGTKTATLHNVIYNGKTSSSMTKVTMKMLTQYQAEAGAEVPQ